MDRLRTVMLIALTATLSGGCESSSPSSIDGPFTVLMEVTAPGAPASWTGF